MTVFLLRRIGYSLVTIILASVIVFALSRMSGDPRLLYLNAFSHVGPEVWEAWGRKLGLDKPLPLQYLYWLRDVLLGDWGESIDTGIPVWTAVTDRVAPYAETHRRWFYFRRACRHPSWRTVRGVPELILGLYGQDDGCSGTVRTRVLAGNRSDPDFLGQAGVAACGRTGRDFALHHAEALFLVGLARQAFCASLASAMLDVMDSEYVKLARAKGVGKFTLDLEARLQKCPDCPANLWRSVACRLRYWHRSDGDHLRPARSGKARPCKPSMQTTSLFCKAPCCFSPDCM